MGTYCDFWLATKQYDEPIRYGYDWFLSAIDKVWNIDTRKVDWLDYERLIVDIFNSDKLTSDQKIELAKEALDAYTRRGHFSRTAD